MAIKCKRIIDGKTYNTETATQVFGWNSEDNLEWDRPHSAKYLYQNRFGAFFLYEHSEGDYRGYFVITPQSSDDARTWLETHASQKPELIEQFFGQMPEAGSGEIKFTLRLPENLRDQLAALAKVNAQSLNAWIIKCLESCASDHAKAK